MRHHGLLRFYSAQFQRPGWPFPGVGEVARHLIGGVGDHFAGLRNVDTAHVDSLELVSTGLPRTELHRSSDDPADINPRRQFGLPAVGWA